MCKYFVLLFSLLLCSVAKLSGQTIRGVITDKSGEKLSNVNILIKNADTPNLIAEFAISSNDGTYEITLKSEIENIIVEVIKLGYETNSFRLTRPQLEQNHRLDVILVEQAVVMEEIVITQKPKIEVKGDTVNYRASAFLDGSERKVEDLLRKIPGVQVDDQGWIKYRGKNVERVLLDGDDLFDLNYTVGTQNMSVGVVDEVQAIENFIQNPLLAGIEDSDKVALNLKLKKGKVGFSGESLLGYGIEERYIADVNALTISSSNKNFTTLSYNNVGENNSPYNYFSFFPSPDEAKNQSFKAPKLIHEMQSVSGAGEKRGTINNSWFTSMNNIYKFSKRLNARVILSYYNDQLDFFNTNRSDFVFENGIRLTTSQNEHAVKTPEQYDGSVKLTWNSSPTSLLEFTSKWNNEKITTTSDLLTNDQNNLFTRLNSLGFFTKQELLFTKKLNKTHTFQLNGAFSYNDSGQDFHLSPGLNFSTGTIIPGTNNRQQNDFSRTYWEMSGTLLGAGKTGKFQVNTGVRYWQNQLGSLLYQNGALLGESYQNNLVYNLLEANLEGSYNFKFRKFSIKPGLRLKNFTWHRAEALQDTSATESRFAVMPQFSAAYKINNIMRLNANYSYEQKPPQENNLFSAYILSSNRTLVRNSVTMQFSKISNAGLGYELNDIYNHFILNASLNYFRQQNNFYSDNTVTQNLTTVRYFFLPRNNDTYNAALSLEKYVPLLLSTIKFTGSYTSFHYKNVINGSDLRNNRSDIVYMDFFGKTALNIPVNFENKIRVQNSVSTSDSYERAFTNTSIANTFKTLVKYNANWFATLSMDYFRPSVENNSQYFFLDAMIRYRSANKAWELSLTGKNLTNNKVFKEVFVSDYYQSVSTQSLNKAYVLCSIGFQF